MMSRRQVRRGLVVAAGCGLLGAVLAGCGSVTGSIPAGGAASTPGANGTAATAAASAAVLQVGCAGVNQATMVTISRLTHLALSRPSGPLLVTDREPALVRALFRDFCDAVTHPDTSSAVMHCPADFGTDYAGVFYDGSRVLARYTYAASGCQRVGIIVGSTTRSTMVAGRAASAAPHLAGDWAAVLDAAKPAGVSSPAQVNPEGTNKPTVVSSPAQFNPGGTNKPTGVSSPAQVSPGGPNKPA
jgi:hypothetical protein